MRTTKGAEHQVDRRARMLADALQHRIDVLAGYLAPDRGPRAMQDQKTRREALNWWLAHRYDQYGAQMIARMDPNQVLELDNELAAFIQEQQIG